MSTQVRKGYIYVIGALVPGDNKKLCKIGKTGNVNKRLSELCNSSPVPLILLASFATNDPDNLEKNLHRAFVGRRSHGEWFRLSDNQIRWFQSLSDYYLDDNPQKVSPGLSWDTFLGIA